MSHPLKLQPGDIVCSCIDGSLLPDDRGIIIKISGKLCVQWLDELAYCERVSAGGHLKETTAMEVALYERPTTPAEVARNVKRAREHKPAGVAA